MPAPTAGRDSPAGRSRPNIAPETGLGRSAPLGGGLTNNARLALTRPSSRSPSASTIHGSGRVRAILGAGNLTGSVYRLTKKAAHLWQGLRSKTPCVRPRYYAFVLCAA
jgi:hypothetical protein